MSRHVHTLGAEGAVCLDVRCRKSVPMIRVGAREIANLRIRAGGIDESKGTVWDRAVRLARGTPGTDEFETYEPEQDVAMRRAGNS